MSKAKSAKKVSRITSAKKTPGTVKRPSAEPKRTLQIDKLGSLITWHVPSAPYADNENMRAAFVGGFEARVQHVNSALHGEELVAPERFPKDSKSQQAFEDGYHDAARQDGRSNKPAGLAGK